MSIKKSFGVGMAVMAAVAATSAGFAGHNDATREQLHRMDLSSRDLIPAFAQQMRDPGYGSTSSSYNNSISSDQSRAMMSLGAFRGQAEAFHAMWDRYPDASFAGALSDLDVSYRTADQDIRRARTTSDIRNRWSRIRQAYVDFRRNISLDNSGYNNGRYNNNGYNDGSTNNSWKNSDPNSGYDNSTNSDRTNGYYDSNGNYHSYDDSKRIQRDGDPQIEVNPVR